MEEFENSCWDSNDDDRCLNYQSWTKIPEQAFLEEMRKPLRKRKIPFFLENKGNHEQIGWYSVSVEDDPVCSWLVIGGTEKSFTFNELCKNQDRERDRYEFGMLVAAFCDNFGTIIRRIYGDGFEVLEYKTKCFVVSSNFKHWAKVRANHMIFPK